MASAQPEYEAEEAVIAEMTKYSPHDVSDYTLLGYEIDIEASGTISKGNKIIAQENSQYVEPTIGNTSIPYQGLASLSKDGSVGIAIGRYVCFIVYFNARF